jgi:hypothetical protein
MVSDNKLFLEELLFLVKNERSLNENIIDQIIGKYNKSRFLITQVYQVLENNKSILPFFNDIEATIIEYIVREEMSHEKTYYGATLFVADLFETTPTYIKCKVNQSRKSLQKIS